jgi:hypothetical protein
MLTTERAWEVTAAARLRSAPDEVILKFFVAFSLLVAGLLSACTRPASLPAVVHETSSAPGITIEQVQVSQGAGIYVAGRSSLPNGECIKTELLANQEAVKWWPRDVCVEIDLHQWEILAALGRNGAPERLDPNLKYKIHVWWPKDPAAISTEYPFDLNGPKQ